MFEHWVWRNEEDFETASFLGQSLSFKTYKMFITGVFTHVVLEVCITKIYDVDLNADTGNKGGLCCHNHGYQREICDGLEIKLA